MAKKSVTAIVRKKHWNAALNAVRIREDEFQIKTTQCPIALAVRDKFEGYFVSVWPDVVHFGTRKSNSLSYTLDKAGLTLIEAFDAQEWEPEKQDWTKTKPQGKPTFLDGKQMPKFPVKVTLTLD
jgi:hypothetical protein